MGMRVALALIRSDTFQCYAQLLAVWPSDVPVEAVVLGALVACNKCAVAFTLQFGNTGRLGRFAEYVRALHSSQLLEHAARALLRAEEEVVARPSEADIMADCNESANATLSQCVLPLQFSEIRCLLSDMSAGITDATGDASVLGTPVSEVLDTALEVREVLSGPCLQFWLGRGLVVAQLRATGGAGPSYGLPDPRALVAAPWAMGAVLEGGPDLERRLMIASQVWGVLASVPKRPPPAADAAAAAADGATPSRPRRPSWRSDGLSYSEAQVYDMAHGALACVLQGREARGGVLAGIEILPPAVLLVRLTLRELRPAGVWRRLPGLWRSLVALLSSIDAAEALASGLNVHPNMFTFTCVMGHLLRLEVQPGPRQAAQQPADGRQAGDAGAAAAPPPGCSFSLRCALDAGLLPALERTLRRLAPIATQEACRLCLYAVNCMLRYSGVWPAVLAHGSVREVASLIETLRKAMAVADGTCLEYALCAEDEDIPLHLPPPAEGGQQSLGRSYLAALMEQVLAALMPLPASPGPAGDDSGRSGSVYGGSDTGCDGRRQDTQAVDRGDMSGHEDAPETAAAPIDVGLLLNAAIEPKWSVPIDHDRLVRAGGRPTPGSPAARQQRTLAALALVTWQESLYAATTPGMFWAPYATTVSGACIMVMATQTLRALSYARGASGSAGAGGSMGPAIEEGRDWLSFVGNFFQLTASLLRSAICGHMPVSLETVLSFLAVYVAARPCEDARRLCQDIITECVTPACGDGGHAATSLLQQGGAASDGAPKGILSPPADFNEAAGRLRALLLAHDWAPLLAVLEAVEPRLRSDAGCGVDEASSPGCGGGEGGSTSGRGGGGAGGEGRGTASAAPKQGAHSLPAALAALTSHCLASVSVARMPLLPKPSGAVQEAIDAGVSLCANRRCVNLEGPSEAALFRRKVCSRCRAASYCSGACQLAHWRVGHASKCPGAGAATGPS